MKLHNTMTPDEQSAFNAHLNKAMKPTTLKRKFPYTRQSQWQKALREIGDAVRKRNEGPLIGSLEDLMRGLHC